MAHNGREIKSMKSVRCIFLMLFSGLLLVLEGCDFRDMLDDYPVSGVQIKLDWTGVTDKLPETMRVIFYPKDGDGKKVDTFLDGKGGDVTVLPGRYAVVVYNYHTENEIWGDDSYETIEARAGDYTDMDKDRDLVWSPSPLYVVALDEVEIEQSDVPLRLEWKPEAVVNNYSFDIKVEGWDRISSIVCYVDGLNGSYFMGKHACGLSKKPIHVETKPEDGLLWGYFSHFVSLKDAKTRADNPMMLTVKIVKRDKTVQDIKVDIAELVAPTPTPPSGGGGEEEPDAKPDAEIHIEVPVPDGEIVVDELEPGTGGEGGGGIGGDVGDWGDEDNVELPV